MRKIAVQDAVGMKLCHDITKVVPGEFKGRVFKRDHVIQPEDIDELLRVGKENIYVWEDNVGEIHEDDAAIRIAQAIMGDCLHFLEPQEGKTVLEATEKGLLQLNSALLYELNSIPDVTIPTLPNNFKVEKGQKVAGARIVPLVTPVENIEKVEQLCKEYGPVCSVKTYKKLKAAVIITGNEVFKGRIKDKFWPVIKKKMEYFEAEILAQVFCPDEVEVIAEKIVQYKKAQADLIIVTGGMSVDPDDLTPGAIKSTGAEIVTYGLPVQPGNMFLLAYLDGTPIMGVPGAATYFKTTILDVILPRIFIGETIEKKDLIQMGEGGLCMNCPLCQYPNCYFCR